MIWKVVVGLLISMSEIGLWDGMFVLCLVIMDW